MKRVHAKSTTVVSEVSRSRTSALNSTKMTRDLSDAEVTLDIYVTVTVGAIVDALQVYIIDYRSTKGGA